MNRLALLFLVAGACIASPGVNAHGESPSGRIENAEDCRLISRMPPPAPRLAWIGDLPKVQAEVDQVYLEIFSTPTGRHWLKDIFTCDPAILRHHLDISEAGARRIQSICGKDFKSVDPSRLKEFPDSLAAAEKIVKGPRHCTFLSLESTKQATGDLTDGDTVSDPFLRTSITSIYADNADGSFNHKKLRVRLLHELAIHLDSKGVMISPMFTANAISPNDIQPNMAKVAWAISNPLLVQAFASIRAFQVEEKVRHEFSDDTVSAGAEKFYELSRLAAQDNSRCLDAVSELLRHFLKDRTAPGIAEWIWLSGKRIVYPPPPRSDAPLVVPLASTVDRGRIRDETISDFMTIQASSIRDPESGRLLPLCPWIAKPRLSGANTILNTGPRPKTDPE